MTIYYQGGEQESIVETISWSTSGSRYDNTKTRGSVSGTATFSAGAALTDFWISMMIYNGSTIYQPSDVFAVFYNMAGTPVVRLPAVSGFNGSFGVQYWDGTAWVDTSISRGYIWNAIPKIVLRIKPGVSGKLEMWQDGILMGSETISMTAFSDVAYVMLYTTRGSFGYSQITIADQNLRLTDTYTSAPLALGTDAGGTGAVTTVNAAAPNDATFMEFSAAGEKRSVTLATRSTANNVIGITVAGRLLRVDGTGPQKARPYLLISGTRYYGTTFSLTTGWAPYQYTWGVNPATSAAWTTAAANSSGLEVGWEAVT